jgi:hypothetical protein
MGTFDELYANLSTNPRIRGFEFEHVCQFFLQNDPTYASHLKRVWLWKEWPDRWGDADSGIDLVGEDLIDGKLWAIQAKAYAAGRAIPKRELNQFLSESNRAVISYRLLITTSAAGLHRIAAETVAAQEKPVLIVDLADLRTSPVDWPATLEDLPLRIPAIEIDNALLPLSTAEEFVEALRVRDIPDPRFERWMALLEGFVEAAGHARVPVSYSIDGQRLGRFVVQQRQLWSRGKLSPARVERLQRLPGWTFSVHEASWHENYHQLAKFVSTHGSPSIPVDFEGENGICLAAWMVNQRTRRAAGTLAPHRVRLLEAVPGWTWDRSGTSNTAAARSRAVR